MKKNPKGYFDVAHPLTLTITGQPIGVFSGRNVYWDATSVPMYPTGYINPPSPTVPSDSDLYTHAMAVSNPNRPIADVGMIAQDVWEFPKLMRDIVGFAVGAITTPTSLMRGTGKNYLTYEFGLQPTIDDLKTSLDFVQAVEKRTNEIRALRSRGLSRTTRFGTSNGGKSSRSNPPHYSATPQTHTDYAISLYGSCPQYTGTYERRAEVWVSTKFKLADDSWLWHPNMGPLDFARGFLDAGPNQMAEIWELMPWSWLINWFSNVGDVFTANRNSLGTTCTEACVMKHTYMEVTDLHISSTGGWTGINIDRAFTRINETKSRKVYLNPAPTLSFHLPFLDGGQLSILAALADSRIWGR